MLGVGPPFLGDTTQCMEQEPHQAKPPENSTQGGSSRIQRREKSKYCNLTHDWKSRVQNCCVSGRKGGKNGKKDKIKESLLVPKCGYYLKAVEMGVACEMR